VISGEPIEGDYAAGTGSLAPGAFPQARSGPTALRMVLGTTLRRYREAARLGEAEAGNAIRGSHSKISRIELGRVAAKQRDVGDLLTLYGVTDQQVRGRLLELARQAGAPGWWQQFADVMPDWFERYLGLERAASEIRGYEVQFVHGLLQTQGYARAVSKIGNQHVSAEEIERKVALRMERQRLLTDPAPPRIWAVLDEAALRRSPNGPETMRGQLRHLLEVTGLPHVRLQIVPFRNGAHPASGGPCSILRFDGWDIPDVVFLEQRSSALYLDDPDQVRDYRIMMDNLVTQAVTPEASREMLAAILRET
jgi:hypothetical protein